MELAQSVARILTISVAALVLCIEPRGAEAADAGLVEAAKKEGEVVWYTTSIINQLGRPMAEAFQKKYPEITVKYTRAMNAETALKIMNEARAGRVQADLFDGSTTMFPLIDAGLVADYLPPSASTLPAEFKDKDRHWAALNVLFLTAAYNTELVKKADAPKTFADLLNPRWKGRIAWTNEPNVNGPPGFIGNVLRAMGQDKGMEYLRALAAQKVVNVPAAQRVVLDQVIAGEYPISLMIFNHHAAISTAAGAPVQWIAMEPLVATMNYISMVKAAPHPSAAKLMMDFMLSDEGQKVLASTGYLPSQPHVPAKQPELKPEQGGFKTTIFSPTDVQKNAAGWTKIYDTLFK